MKFTTSLFSQILQVVPRTSFLRLVYECRAERHAKGFSSWDQCVARTGPVNRKVRELGQPSHATFRDECFGARKDSTGGANA